VLQEKAAFFYKKKKATRHLTCIVTKGISSLSLISAISAHQTGSKSMITAKFQKIPTAG
jgi:hypothetical protein